MNFQVKPGKYSLLILSPVFMFFSCRQASKANNAENRYYYFPETNVYYDQGAGLYFYSLDSGKNWSSFPYDKSNKSLRSDNKVEVMVTNNEPVWKQNDLHISTYNGTRLAILTADTGMSNGQKFVEKKSIKTASGRSDSMKAVGETKKSNFFQRLFGKKKKKN